MFKPGSSIQPIIVKKKKRIPALTGLILLYNESTMMW